MGGKYYDSVEEVIEIDGEDREVTFERETTVETDSNYGADADGNRGMSVDFIEEDTMADVVIDGKPLEEYPKEFKDKAETAIEKWMSDHPPTD